MALKMSDEDFEQHTTKATFNFGESEDEYRPDLQECYWPNNPVDQGLFTRSVILLSLVL